MKRILWCSLVLIVWALVAYFCYRVFGSELAGYIVGVVGTAGTFAAMFFTPPSTPEVNITTEGDYSPGKVDGNFSVGSGNPPPEDNAKRSNPSTQENLKIQTKGDFSPGWVGGNYQITQTIIQQYEKTRRKTWRELSEATFPLLSDREASHQQLWSTLSEAAALSFRDQGFTRFTFILHRSERQVEDQVIPVYSLLTNQPQFCSTAHRNYSELFHDLVAWKNSGSAPDGRAAIEQKFRAKLAGLEHWSKSVKLSARDGWIAVQCTCDSAAKSCDFLSLDRYSLDPADYDQHVRLTSEMLLYIVSAFHTHIATMGDLGWYNANYSLLKLTIKLLDDHAIDMGAIRFNVDDPEEWDYLNGDFDAEIRNFLSTKKS